MRRILASIALTLLCGAAHAQSLVSNPLILPSATFTTGDCIQATGPTSIASTGTPCGSGGGGGSGNVTGPTTSTIGAIPVWSNGTGTGLADSSIAAASIPLLGATQTWGGINTYEVRPIFNGATPWDSANLNISDYLTTANAAATYLTQTNAASTYLTQSAAGQTYATILGVQSAYLRITDAASTYLTQANAASTYLTITNAATTYTTPAEVNAALSTFLTIANANSTYLKIAGGAVGPLSNLTSGNSSAPTLQLISGDSASQTNFIPSSLAGGQPSGPSLTNSMVQAGDASFLSYRSGGTPALTIGVGALSTTGSPGGIRISGNGISATIAMGVRPTYAGNLAWDAGNFNPAQYLTTANAASTYLTIANAAATYQPISSAVTPAQLALKANIASPTFTGIATSPAYTLNAAAGTWKPISFNSGASQRWQIGGDNGTESGSNSGTNFEIVSYADNGAPLGTAMTITRATDIVSLMARPTWAGFTPWDSGNFAPGNYLTTATAASTYFPLAGGTITGATQFNQTPTIANQSLPVTDSSPDVPTTSWTQSVITNRVGTGPFLPLTGVGMPYDIVIPYQGTVTPPTIPAGTHVLHYLFVRKVTIPVGFVSSAIECISSSTGTVDLGITSTGAAGGIGNLEFTAGSIKGAFKTTGGPFVFMPGDILAISTSGNTPDATLGGIFGTIEGAISN
jgi:hypothetical protein